MSAWSNFLDVIGAQAPAPTPVPVAPDFDQSGQAVNGDRFKMAHQIYLFEREVDAQGRLMAYKLPADDGGVTPDCPYEVAGINGKYDHNECLKLIAMVKAGQYDQAEQEATLYIQNNTDPVMKWCQCPAIEANLRDIYFNRGGGGCMKILQKALGVATDGDFGPITESTEKAAESDPSAFLDDLYDARVWYEDTKIGVRDNLDKGLMNRFAAARDYAKTLI